MGKEYKSIYYRENKMKAMLAGTKTVVHDHMTKFMNAHAQGGWRFISMGKWKKDTFLMIFERDI